MCITTWFDECNHSLVFSCGFQKYSKKCFPKQLIEETYCNKCFKEHKIFPSNLGTRFFDPLSLYPLSIIRVLDGFVNIP